MRRLLFANLLMTLRNRQALFWTLFFPLVFILIFGMFFSNGSGNLGQLAVIDLADNDISRQLTNQIKEAEVLTVTLDYDSVDEAKTALGKNQIVGAITFPEGFGESRHEIQLLTSAANPNANAALQSLSSGMVGGLNEGVLRQVVPQSNALLDNPTFTVATESTSSTELTYFDFVLIGIIGMSLMNSAVNGVAISMSKYREDQILKRITTTPLPTWKFIVAEVISRLAINLVQVGIIIVVATKVFNGHILGNLWILIGLALLGAILFQLMGFAIAALTSSTRAAEGMTTAVTMPMMFLAGVFFPTDSLPQWLQSAVKFLPLEPLVAMMRQVGLEQSSPLTEPRNLAILLGWIVVLLFISIRRFRLGDEK